jgi:thioredoxin reductase
VTTHPATYDAIIVGAGPAGLNAALVLGRCRRRVAVFDADRPRNAASRALHGFLSRDGIPPADLRRVGREQLAGYPSVELHAAEVVSAACHRGGFDVTLRDGRTFAARKLVLATGMIDELPDIPGMREFYGRGVYHCPYCDGWEVRDRPLAAYGKGRHGWGLGKLLLGWSRDIVVCTDGPADLDADDRAFLDRHGVRLNEQRLVRLEGDAELERAVFADGTALSLGALFFNTSQQQRSRLPEMLGCDLTERGTVDVNMLEMTSVPGLYVIGDASRDVQLAIVAAAEGAKAAFAVNKAMLEEDFR